MDNDKAKEVILENMGAESNKKDVWPNNKSKWLENPQ